MENPENNEKVKIEIMVASPEDARGIKEVQYKTWLATYPNTDLGITTDDIDDRFKNALTDEGIKKTEERISNESAYTKTLVAKANGKTIGFCICTKSETQNQLNAIYVLPEYQGSGIGRRFWEEAIKFFDSEKDIVVEVADYNIPAISFYQSLGFVDSGKRMKDERFILKSGVVIPEMEMTIKRKSE